MVTILECSGSGQKELIVGTVALRGLYDYCVIITLIPILVPCSLASV